MLALLHVLSSVILEEELMAARLSQYEELLLERARLEQSHNGESFVAFRSRTGVACLHEISLADNLALVQYFARAHLRRTVTTPVEQAMKQCAKTTSDMCTAVVATLTRRHVHSDTHLDLPTTLPRQDHRV